MIPKLFTIELYQSKNVWLHMQTLFFIQGFVADVVQIF